jgi:hypothetical protein
LVKGYSWRFTDGIEFQTEVGRISTQVRNLVLESDRPIRKFDNILFLSKDLNTGELVQPFDILSVYIVQDVTPARDLKGKLEFWKCRIIESSTYGGRKGGIGTSHQQEMKI